MKIEERVAGYSVQTKFVGLFALGDVVKPTRPRVKPSEKPDLPFIGMEHIEAHTMKLLGTVPARTMKSSAVHFKSGDVLYGRLRPYLNKVYRPNFEGLCSAEFIVLPENEQIDGAYLQYFLNSSAFVRYASHLNAGDRPRVDFDQLAPYEIPLPKKQQQTRIVAEIEKQFSRLDEAVANLKRVKANIKRYKAAVLKAAVEGHLVETEAELARREGRSYETGAQLLQRILESRRSQWQGKGKYKEPAAPDTTDLPELPEGWVWATIGQAAECLDSKRVPVNKKERLNRSGSVPYYGANGRVGFIDDYIFDEPLVLVVEDETFTGREQPFSYKISGKSWVNNHAHVLRPTGMVSLDYLNYALSFYPFTPLTTGTTGRKKLTQLALVTAPIRIPPLLEQHRIVAEIDRHLSLANEAEAQVNANLQRAERLRQSILAKAFSSEVND